MKNNNLYSKNLKLLYKDSITLNLKTKFDYKNIHEVPKIIKIQLNCGLGIESQNKKILERAIEEVRLITGQQPVLTKAKKSIAGFKIREDMILGLTVTLRNKKMYEFLTKLIHLVLPRIRDFRGLSIKGFDRKGNYNFGLKEQLVFPEINYEDVKKINGFNISLVTTAQTEVEGKYLLEQFGFPIQRF
uniref:50S ribosomal protein L5, chloroplastic n=1 Tax=Phaeophyceae sp. TaxID=2249243 RepID=A0A8E5BGR0_9PHAE|nr:ribosomal protein L5 [Phaeophyceae sp.]